MDFIDTLLYNFQLDLGFIMISSAILVGAYWIRSALLEKQDIPTPPPRQTRNKIEPEGLDFG